MALELSLLVPDDLGATMTVVKECFEVCVAPDYTHEGCQLFAEAVTAEYVSALPQREGFCLVAKVDGRTVGMCAIRDRSHVTLFFVLPEFQGQGIGRMLFTAAVERVRWSVPGVTSLQVHSSPVAVPVYKALSFTVTGGERVEGGIRYIPMELSLAP